MVSKTTKRDYKCYDGLICIFGPVRISDSTRQINYFMIVTFIYSPLILITMNKLQKSLLQFGVAIPFIYIPSFNQSSALSSQATLKTSFPFQEYQCNEQESNIHQLYSQIKQFLAKPSAKKRKMFPSKEWEMIALSHISEGLVYYGTCHNSKKQEVHQLLEQIVQETTTTLSPYPKPIQTAQLDEHGLYLTHLNIILASYQQIAQDKKYFPLQEKISQYLAEKTTSDSQKHVRSYAHLPHKWPADQSATFYSLWRFDQQYNTSLSVQPINQWLGYMNNKATDPKTHLPYSNITGKNYGKIPRGCALSWSIRYMNFFAPQQAKKLWSKYKQSHYDSGFFISGFREFPRGINGQSDSDSGPIIQGIGVAASGFALPTSKVMGDHRTYNALEKSKNTVEIALGISGHKKAINSSMAASIEFYTAALPL